MDAGWERVRVESVVVLQNMYHEILGSCSLYINKIFIGSFSNWITFHLRIIARFPVEETHFTVRKELRRQKRVGKTG